MRDALTLFDQVVAYCGEKIEYEAVIKNLNVLDYEYYFKLIDFSLQGDFADGLVLFDEVLNKGFNALYFIGGLGNHLRNLLICKESASANLLQVSPSLEQKYKEQSERCPLKFLFKAIAAVEKCSAEYPKSNNQRLLVEFMLVRLSQLQEAAAVVENPKAETPKIEIPKAETPKAEIPKAETPKTEVVKPAIPQKEVVNNSLSINSLMQQVKQSEDDRESAKSKTPLDFMGEETNKPVTEEAVKQAWGEMADFFAATYPTFVRFVATIKNATPSLLDDKVTVEFPIGNSEQKKWIEKNARDKMSNFLRKSLLNNSVNVSVVIKSREQVAEKLYLPQEKEAYLERKNAEFLELKRDMGMELN